MIFVLLALWLAQPVQDLFFGGDFRDWLSQQAGKDPKDFVIGGIDATPDALHESYNFV